MFPEELYVCILLKLDCSARENLKFSDKTFMLYTDNSDIHLNHKGTKIV